LLPQVGVRALAHIASDLLHPLGALISGHHCLEKEIRLNQSDDRGEKRNRPNQHNDHLVVRGGCGGRRLRDALLSLGTPTQSDQQQNRSQSDDTAPAEKKTLSQHCPVTSCLTNKS